MGKSQRKEKDIQIRRDEILDAAERLYERESFDAVTMDKIAVQAEFTKQTVYSYFKGKDEILAAVYVRAARTINTAFEKRLRQLENASGYDKLDAMRGVLVEAAVQKPLYIKMMAFFQIKDVSEISGLGVYEQLMNENSRLVNYMGQCIVQGIKDKSIAGDIDVKSGALFLNALVSGALCLTVFNEHYIRKELKVDPIETLKDILQFSMRSFRNNI